MAEEKDAVQQQTTAADDGAKKKSGSKKISLSARIAKFFRDYKSELKKIVWSPKKDVIKNTSVVLITIVISAIFIGILDYGFTEGLRGLNSLFN